VKDYKVAEESAILQRKTVFCAFRAIILLSRVFRSAHGRASAASGSGEPHGGVFPILRLMAGGGMGLPVEYDQNTGYARGNRVALRASRKR